MNRILAIAALVVVASCAKAATGGSGGADGGPGHDASCGELCDQDGDGVVDGSDMCPGTVPGAMVNDVGCAESQVTPMLDGFPPYGLTWTPTGELGRAGGLTWTYTGIQRADLFHIDWIVCDDPATPCGLSLDGPIDVTYENWVFSSSDSELANGKLVYTNTTHIRLDSGSTPTLTGRLTLRIVDASDVPLRFADVGTLGVTARMGTHGAEIPGTGFKVTALGEVQEIATTTWTPYLDYYDAAPTPMAGGAVTISFGASFYSE